MAWSICCCELHGVACKSTIVKHGQKLSIEVEAQPVPQKTTFSHKNQAESARRVKQRQQEGTGHNKGVQKTSEERTTDRDLGAPSPATVPTIPYQSGHGRGDTGRGAQGEGRRAKEPANKGVLRGAKLSASHRGARKEKE